jgi:hypothetical protein
MNDEHNTPTGGRLELQCQKCGDPYPASITGEMLETLVQSGVGLDEITAAVERGLVSQELVCPSCAAVALN